MKRMVILAAALSLAACHNKNEDQTTVTPDKGATAAAPADTTKMAPSAAAAPRDSASHDSAMAMPAVPAAPDSTMAHDSSAAK